MPRHPNTVRLEGFKGINNQLRPERTNPQFLKEAINVDVDKSGGLTKRQGYSKIIEGDFSSLWSDGTLCYAVKDGELGRLLPDDSFVGTGVEFNYPLSFGAIDGVVYFTGPEGSYMIVNGAVVPWGMYEPNPKPGLMQVGGSLSAGLYQVAITYVQGSTGLESGTTVAQTLTVPGGSGIMLLNIPVSSHPLVTSIRIYASTPDGEELYYISEISNGTTSYTINAVEDAVSPLISFNMYPPPVGHKLSFAHERAFIAQDNILYFSEPYSYHWWNYHQNYFIYATKILNIMPVDNGTWVCTEDGIHYLSGSDTEKMSTSLKEPVRAVEGTEVRIPGPYVFMENTPVGYKWLVTTNRGIFMCFNQGVIFNMTESNYSFDEADKGSAVFIQKDGINKYVPIIEKKRDSDNTAVGDQVSAVIIRNGITLED